MKTEQVFRGSDNVFADIGLPNAEEHLIKAQLVYKIDGIMKDRGLKQVEAASLFGVRQPDVSKMLRGDFRQFSVERLMRFLVALGQDVEIVVKPTLPRDAAKGHLSVVMHDASHAVTAGPVTAPWPAASAPFACRLRSPSAARATGWPTARAPSSARPRS